MTDIKPCPFCGETSCFVFAALHRKWGNVECGRCGATGPQVHTNYEPSTVWQDDATSAWNQRKE